MHLFSTLRPFFAKPLKKISQKVDRFDNYKPSSEVESIGNFLLCYPRRYRLRVHCRLGSGRKCLGLEVGAESDSLHWRRGSGGGIFLHA